METGIYIRVSTEEQAQEGFSIRAQEQKLKDYARIKEWSIYNIYIDEGISGKNLVDRPAMQELIADVNKGTVENVLVFKIDRLTRSTADLLYLVDLFNEQDCAFNSLTESIDTQTPSGRMFLKIIGIFAEFERENIVERSKVGIERKVREGYTIGGHQSYGYEREKGNKIQTINDDEAEIVREIFDMYVNQGVSVTDITRRLNVRNVPAKYNDNWETSSIRRLLSNCNYIGKVRHHVGDNELEYSVEGQHEAIINQELYDNAQTLLSNNAKASPRKTPREENYFSGFVYCGLCGSKMFPHSVYSKKQVDGTRKLMTCSYECKKKAVKACTASGISHKKFERAFEEYIEKIANLDVTDEIEIETQKKQENLAQIKAYKDKCRHLESREREALVLYVDGKMEFESYREMKKIVDSEKTIIAAELKKLEEAIEETPTLNKTDIINDLRENWSLLTASERRQFLLKFIKKIDLIVEKEEGAHYGTAKILDITFQSYSEEKIAGTDRLQKSETVRSKLKRIKSISEQEDFEHDKNHNKNSLSYHR